MTKLRFTTDELRALLLAPDYPVFDGAVIKDFLDWVDQRQPAEPRAQSCGDIALKPGARVTVTTPQKELSGEYIVGEDGVTLTRPAERTGESQ